MLQRCSCRGFEFGRDAHVADSSSASKKRCSCRRFEFGFEEEMLMSQIRVRLRRRDAHIADLSSVSKRCSYRGFEFDFEEEMLLSQIRVRLRSDPHIAVSSSTSKISKGILKSNFSSLIGGVGLESVIDWSLLMSKRVP
ncbi:hypothetical protein PoB_005988000 [Plakobranchus ocellatus]|uniref:SWIM-type domain-containing protein n=1 Tax=Plakobranchus ocellatus TaxID=259542 RepID=A0AAV4CN04_9GAST|nr:hypothetical protein PoB_005988000 [Plakobranchus ocellatus]